ncbi:MAG TPA: BON domain-containing protein [Gemmatimonadaceae bacterium]|nr:BON domain-containing protein [Gemmatimonadaceae bacterium]
MRRPRYVEVRSLNDTLMLLVTGAIAGAAAGIYLGRRYDSVGALAGDVRDRLLDAWDAWKEDEELAGESVAEDELVEDELAEDELAEDELLDDEDEPYLPDEEPLDELEPVSAADELPPHREADVADLPTAKPVRRSLETKVLAGFEADGVLGQRAIDIAAVGDGVIELTGWVRSGEEAARAAALARAVAGVEMVLNRLAVRDPEAWSDDAPEDQESGNPERRTTPPPSGGVAPASPPEGLAP